MALFKTILLVLFSSLVYAQSNPRFSDFKKLSRPEKTWVWIHPFVAKKAFRISTLSKNQYDKLKDSLNIVDYENGGKVDAFRHAWWMMNLCDEIGKRRALSLGKAHERKNKHDYKNNQKENGELPDKALVEMDLFNNKVSLELYKPKSKLSYNQKLRFILEELEKGSFLIISRNSEGFCLNQDGEIIQENAWKGKWNNDRTLVKSNAF